MTQTFKRCPETGRPIAPSGGDTATVGGPYIAALFEWMAQQNDKPSTSRSAGCEGSDYRTP